MLKRKCKITFIAHGATIHSQEGIISDSEKYPPLTEHGHDEIKKVCEYIKKRGIRDNKILCSPAVRCVQSAQDICNVFKQDYEVLEELKVRTCGVLNGKSFNSVIKKYPNNLSGGMRQRVALIRTLATNPDILLLDEAFSALDYQTRLAVSDDVWKIIKKEKKTTIMITHDIAEAISMADRVIVLANRPSKVKKIYNIEMTNSSSPINNRKCPEFNKYYDLIWKDIDIHV